MRTDAITVLVAPPTTTADDLPRLLRALAQAGADATVPGVRTFAILGELTVTGAVDDNARALAHDGIGRLAVRLAVDKTLCVGDSRPVRALYQGAIMEGSWGDEAAHVPTVAAAAALTSAASTRAGSTSAEPTGAGSTSVEPTSAEPGGTEPAGAEPISAEPGGGAGDTDWQPTAGDVVLIAGNDPALGGLADHWSATVRVPLGEEETNDKWSREQ